jgi:hypothetical protein
MITAGISYTAGFVPYRENYGSVCTRTRHGYGFGGCGCGVGKPDPRVTRAHPYIHHSIRSII